MPVALANVHSLGANQSLRRQLDDPQAGFARIYGFSFEGHYYDLPKPSSCWYTDRGSGSPGRHPSHRRP